MLASRAASSAARSAPRSKRRAAPALLADKHGAERTGKLALCPLKAVCTIQGTAVKAHHFLRKQLTGLTMWGWTAFLAIFRLPLSTLVWSSGQIVRF